MFTAATARAAGHSRYQVEARLRAGHWRMLRRGVYCTARRWSMDAADPMRGHLLEAAAARLAVGRFTAVSAWSAAVLHDLPRPAGLPAAVMLTAEHGCRIRRADLHLTVAPLPAGQLLDRVRRADHDCRAHRHRRGAAGERSRFRRRGVRAGRGAARRKGEPGRAGRAASAQAVPSGSPTSARRARSSRGRGCCSPTPGCRCPLPKLRFVMTPADSSLGVDFCWAEYGVVGEADGRGKYVSPSLLYREKPREARLPELGFEVVCWSWSDIHHRRRETAQRIRVALGRGEVIAELRRP